MASYIRTLKDKDENIIYPQTRAKAVYMDNDQTVEAVIKNINSKKDIQISNIQPTDQNVGDFWYKEI